MNKLFLLAMAIYLPCLACDQCIQELDKAIAENQKQIIDAIRSGQSNDVHTYYYLMGVEIGLKNAKASVKQNH